MTRVCPGVEVKNLSLSYNDQHALEDVSLTIPPGQITALVGPSGCGKTSFLNCINRLVELIPGVRVSGEIKLEGVDIYTSSISLVELRRRVGMIFQRPVPFPLSIRKNFHIALKEHGVRSRSERDDRMEQRLREVGLWEEVENRLDKSAMNLSGGQKQRLCIARALVLNPQVLLMDEPCSALDPLSSGAVEELIGSLRERYTVLLVTHNLSQARRIADHVALFWVKHGRGVVEECGSVDQVFNSPRSQITQAYISGRAG